jgi:hypothetical protein
MEIKLINIGFGNIVAANRIVAIVSPESAPIKRIIPGGAGPRQADRCHLRPPDEGGGDHGQRSCHSFRRTAGDGGASA